jgi:hypothetical protein
MVMNFEKYLSVFFSTVYKFLHSVTASKFLFTELPEIIHKAAQGFQNMGCTSFRTAGWKL